MTYCIMTIIYGVPLTSETNKLIRKWEHENDNRWFEDENGMCGFNFLYNGGDSESIPGFCGVILDEFDEARDFIKFSDLKFFPSDEDKKIVFEKISNLHHELRELCEKIDVGW